MCADDAAGAEAAIGEQLVGPAHVARAKMERRDQREIVVVHAARVDFKPSAGGTSAKEHHPAAPPHALERVTPSRNLPGTFDHQVGPEAIVEPRNFAGGIARGGVDYEIGAEPPLGVLYDVPTYIDADLLRDSEIVFSAGSHREAIRMKIADFESVARPTVGRFSTSH